jgi:hypothetical protein
MIIALPPPGLILKAVSGLKVCLICNSDRLRQAVKLVAKDEARRVAANIAKLLELLGKARNGLPQVVPSNRRGRLSPKHRFVMPITSVLGDRTDN